MKSQKGESVISSFLKRYDLQRLRGQEGFGYVSVNKDGFLSEVNRATEEDEILKVVKNDSTPCMLFHHRAPTSVPNYVEATHPFKVSHEMLKFDYYVIHNGVISNDERLFKEYKEKGFVFTSEMVTTKLHDFVSFANHKGYLVGVSDSEINDSEALAVDFALAVEGHIKSMQSLGGAAIIVLQVEKKTGKIISLMYGRNGGYPLKVEKNDDILAIKSEGEGTMIKPNILYRMDWTTGEVTEKAFAIAYSQYDRFEDRPVEKHVPKGGRGVPARAASIEQAIEALVRGTEMEGAVTPGKTLELLPPVVVADAEIIKGFVPLVVLQGGYSKEFIEQVIDGYEKVGDTGQADNVRDLFKDLKEEVDTENEAIQNYKLCFQMFKDVLSQKADETDTFLAKNQLNDAGVDMSSAHKQRLATQAELDTYIGWDELDRHNTPVE